MAYGGVPYYMGYVDGRKSFAQDAKLKSEYDRLFASVFDNPGVAKSIVSFLATRNSGYTRKEICGKLHLEDGGTITRSLVL